MMRWGETICDGLARPAKCAACDLQHRGLSRPIASIVGALPLALSRTASAVPGLGIGALIERNVLREKQLFAHAQAVFVLTEWARRAVEANLGRTDKLHLNRLGVATGFDRPVERSMSSPPRLGFLGRPDPIKGIWVLAEAVSKLEPELDFTLEVRGSFGSDAVRKFRERSLDDRRVRFEPAVSPDEVPAVLARYDVLICPSLALEGGPTVALEAHAMGTPVIGSRIGGLAEIVQDDVNGLLVDPGDAKALASALRRVVAEPDTILAWRNRISKPRTMDEIVSDYLPHYERTH